MGSLAGEPMTATLDNLPKRWRGPLGDLYHLRAVVDGRLIFRRWTRSRWQYVIEGPYALEVGLYSPDGDREEAKRLAHLHWPEAF